MSDKVFLITGGAGFVGHHFVEHFWKNYDHPRIKIIDRLNYSGSLNRLRDIQLYPKMDVEVFTTDFTRPLGENLLSEFADVTHVLHLGAESHVDRSIENPLPFLEANIIGTYHMLEAVMKLKQAPVFYYFSTDEVFGPCYKGQQPYKEDDRFKPSNPYAASKGAGEMLCMAYRNTYQMPIVITRSMNIIGERQHPEKFIPLCINKIREGKFIDIHSDSLKKTAGSRQYIHARNVADGYRFLIDSETRTGEFHIVGEREVSNVEVAEQIAKILGKPLYYRMTDFHSSRPGHDLRYALDGSKMERFGWAPPKTFEESLQKTVEWYLENPMWLVE